MEGVDWGLGVPEWEGEGDRVPLMEGLVEMDPLGVSEFLCVPLIVGWGTVGVRENEGAGLLEAHEVTLGLGEGEAKEEGVPPAIPPL